MVEMHEEREFFFLIEVGLEQKERKKEKWESGEWWKRSHNGRVCRVDLVPTLEAASPQFS